MAFFLRMKEVARCGHRILNTYGLFPRTTIRALSGTILFLQDLRQFKRLSGRRTDWTFGTLMPMLEERDSQSGVASGHYFHQDLLVAQRIHAANPRRHVDVGSRIDGFVAHVASFREIEIVDIRPLDVSIPNVKFVQMDLVAGPDTQHTAMCDSLSCLHVLEHIGLGRYGDRIDPDGYRTGFTNLVKMLEPGGILYFSVPMGRQRIEFNGHRIFGLTHLLEMFQHHNLEIFAFSCVMDDGSLLRDIAITGDSIAMANNLSYGCGIFELKKTAQAAAHQF